jgi:hypothetical protein
VAGPSTEKVVEGNDPHGGHGRVCEGDRTRVGVSHGMVEVKPYCFSVGCLLHLTCVEGVSKICLSLGHLLG